jgi:hypothetical protein
VASSRRRIAAASTRLGRGLVSCAVVGLALLFVAGAEGRSSQVTTTDVHLHVLASPNDVPNGATVEVTPDLDGTSPNPCDSGFVLCDYHYSAPTTVTLTAQPSDAVSHFYGWTAAECPNAVNPCQLPLTGDDPDVSVFALYDPAPILVEVAGPGTLTWSEGGTPKECVGDTSVPPAPVTCDAGPLPARDPIVFTASPDDPSFAIDWFFSCDSVPHNATQCSTVPANRILGVGFDGNVPDRQFDVSATLHVSKTGTGSGTITGSGFDCGAGDGCRKDFGFGDPVTLQAEHAADSRFDGWIGVCGSSPTCHFNAGPTTSVKARFTLAPSTTTTTTTATTTTPPPPPRLKVRIIKLAARQAAGRWLVTARIASNKPIHAHARVGRRRRTWGDRTLDLRRGTHPLTIKLSKRARRGKCWFTLAASTAGGEVRNFPRQTVRLGR